MLKAIAEKAEQEERQGEFQNAAERRYAEILASRKPVPWGEMRCYIERRVAVSKIARPNQGLRCAGDIAHQTRTGAWG